MLLLLIFVVGAWVYRDATRLDREGSPVVLRSRYITLDSPQDWAIACTFVCVVFLPLYLTGARQDA